MRWVGRLAFSRSLTDHVLVERSGKAKGRVGMPTSTVIKLLVVLAAFACTLLVYLNVCGRAARSASLYILSSGLGSDVVSVGRKFAKISKIAATGLS